MECSPDPNFLISAANNYNNNNNNDFIKYTISPKTKSKPRKTAMSETEVDVLLSAIKQRHNVLLFSARCHEWARAWQEVAMEVTGVEGIFRSETDLRRKWNHLKWQAKKNSKSAWDPTLRIVLKILSRGDPAAQSTIAAKSLLQKRVGGQVAEAPQGPIPMQQPNTRMQPVSGPSSAYTTEVCLKWNYHHSNLQTVFSSLLNNEQFVDVTLACEGHSIKCHKVMLSACSYYFEELLMQNPCQHPIILMKDVRFWELQALVDFMYRGEVIIAQERLVSLLAAAEDLQIKGLAGSAIQSPSNAGNCSDNQDESGIANCFNGKRKTASPPTLEPITPVTTHTSSLATPSPSHPTHHLSILLPHKLRKMQMGIEEKTGKEHNGTKSSTAQDKDNWNGPNDTTATIIKSETLDISDQLGVTIGENNGWKMNGTKPKEFIVSMTESGKEYKMQAENNESDEGDYENEEKEFEFNTVPDDNMSLSSNGSDNLVIDEGETDNPEIFH